MTTIYRGRREDDGCVVVILEDTRAARRLPMRLPLRNHSPTGFEWGYAGSGPAQLALALLAHALGDDDRALRLYQDFKFRVIGPLKGDAWEMSRDDVVRIAAAIEVERMESPA